MSCSTRANYVIKHNCDNCIHEKCCKYLELVDELETIADSLVAKDSSSSEESPIKITGEIQCDLYEIKLTARTLGKPNMQEPWL